MKDIIDQLNKVFDNKARLGIMSVLLVNDRLNFNALKELLEMTDGNLSSHLSTLEKNKYIEVKKQFIERKTNTTYRVTPLGKRSFQIHLQALEQLIRKNTKN